MSEQQVDIMKALDRLEKIIEETKAEELAQAAGVELPAEKTKHTHTCKRCGNVWESATENPKNCRINYKANTGCGSILWNTDRKRKVGGGRPKSDFLKTKTTAEPEA